MRYLACTVLLASVASTALAQVNYPPTKTVDVSDTYFGKAYADPYRWLENLKSPEVVTWFKAQANLTDQQMAKIPGRQALVDEWTALDKLKPASYQDISFQNGRAFYKKTLGGENVGKLYYRQGWDGAEKLLFDPETYSQKSKTVLQYFAPSWDGEHVVLGLSAGGAEFAELRVLTVADGSLLPDSIYPSMFGPNGWNRDNTSFFYDACKVTDIKSPEIELHHKTRLHKLGTAASDDIDFFSDESYPSLGIQPKEFALANIDEAFPDYVFGLLATVQNEMKMVYAPASAGPSGKMNWKVLCQPSDNIVRGLVVFGNHFYAITHTDAPRYKVVRTSLDNPDWSHAETILPEAADSVQSLTKSRHYMFITYSNGIVGRVVKYEFATGKISEVTLPFTGTVVLSVPDWKTDLCHIVITSWTKPATRFDYDAEKETISKSSFNSDVVYPGFDNLVAEEVECPSHDGVMVPLSIIHRKDIPLDGSSCCILDGYGAYGISEEPYFTVLHSVALHGVVLAFSHPRGGSEKGEAWYKGGFKTTKPNTWKDFIACGEYLVAKGYTRADKLCGTGTSAGGILITRAITERPDLFRAAICNVGCANAMRMEFSPNGPANIPEFGTVADEKECQALYEMDGVQHVKKGVSYPAVMGVTGWNDPRVSPWEPGKFIAALQNASTSGLPVLLKVNYDDGHFTEEKTVTFNNFAAQSAFLLWQTGHKDFQPAGGK